MQDDCMQIRNLMPVVANRQADAETQNAVAAHLTYCRECARYYTLAVRDMPTAPTLDELLSGDIPPQARASAEKAVKEKSPRSRSLILIPLLAVLLVLLLQGMVTGNGRFSASAAVVAEFGAAAKMPLLATYDLDGQQLFLFVENSGDTPTAMLCSTEYRFPLWYMHQQYDGVWDSTGMMQAIGWQTTGETDTDAGYSIFFWQSRDPAVAYVEWQLTDGLLRMYTQPPQENGSPTPVWQLVSGQQAFVSTDTATPLIIAYDENAQPLYELHMVETTQSNGIPSAASMLSWQAVPAVEK